MCLFFLIFATEVFKQGVWPALEGLDDPELIRLAEKLPATVLQSRAQSSTKKYMGGFRRWKAWAQEHKLTAFPVEGRYLALYLQHIGEHVESKAAAEEAVNSLAWAHSLAGLPPPSHHPLVQATLEGLKRTLAKPVAKKSPMTAEILTVIVKDTMSKPTLSNVRLATACLLAYAGFLRADELISLHPCDIDIAAERMLIHITHSKTDQFRQGDQVPIARTGNNTCPVAMLERYLQVAQIPMGSKEFLFRPITKTKTGERLRASGKLSYSTLRELFKKKLTELGYPAAEFGLHSLRAGGATAAANAGVPDRLFKRHGRWRSDSAKDGYIEDSTVKRLSVSKSIGLYPFLCVLILI